MANTAKLRHSTEAYRDGVEARGLLDQNAEDEHHSRAWRSFSTGSRGALVRLLAISFFSLVLGALLGNVKSYRPGASNEVCVNISTDNTSNLLSEVTPRTPAGFHLLVPENTASDKLCKVLLAANLLGYPRPVVLNWEEQYFDFSLRHGGSHTAKITGTLKYLNSLDESQQDDLVLLIDALDVWFQLRPSVLIERYFDINRRADDRIRQNIGPWNMDHENIRTKVIFSSQKGCYPVATDDNGCAGLTESILPPKLYGEKTDTFLGGTPESQPWHNYRYEHLNSGSAMGTVAGMKAIFERAAAYLKDGPHNYKGSDQGIFGDILGEQEAWRRMIGARGSGTGEDIPTLESLQLKEDTNYEFGLVLDFESQLIYATNADMNESGWIHYNDPDEIARLTSDVNMKYPHVGNLPLNVARSKAPFADYPDSAISADDGPGMDEVASLKDVTWEEVALYTSLRTGFTPVALHHNEWTYGAKNRIVTTWNQTWFQPYSLAMFSALRNASDAQGLGAGQKEYAMGTLQVDDKVFAYAAQRMDDGIVRTDKGNGSVPFEDMCGSSFEELFRGQRQDWVGKAR